MHWSQKQSYAPIIHARVTTVILNSVTRCLFSVGFQTILYAYVHNLISKSDRKETSDHHVCHKKIGSKAYPDLVIVTVEQAHALTPQLLSPKWAEQEQVLASWRKS